MFEIGLVYKNRAHYFIAVTNRSLIRVTPDKVIECKPYTKTAANYGMVRSISVEEVCDFWNIDTCRLDEAMQKYLAPVSLRTRPRGGGRLSLPGSEFSAELAKAAMTVCLPRYA